MWQAISGLLGGIAKPIVDHYTRKRELSAQEHANAMQLLEAQGKRQAELAMAGLTADANWEMEFARQAASSWKDEYVLLTLSIPALLCFVKFKVGSFAIDGAAIVSAGFDALSRTPGWYQLAFLTVFLATYGIRYWRRTQSDT